MKKLQRGFTLIELLVVIGILAILTAIVLVAVNPGRQFAQARDTQRRADVTTISAAIVAYMSDPANRGNLPAGITEACVVDGAPNPAIHHIGAAVGNLDLNSLVAPDYVAAIPMDPTGGTADDTGYTVCVASATARRITVSAPNTELTTPVISVTR